MNEPRVELPDFFLLLLLLRVADSHILAVLLLRTGKQAAALRSQLTACCMIPCRLAKRNRLQTTNWRRSSSNVTHDDVSVAYLLLAASGECP
jgi:hypothetical protein